MAIIARLICAIFWFCVGAAIVWVLAAVVSVVKAAEPGIAGWAGVQGCTQSLGIAVLYDDGHWEGRSLADVSDPLKVQIVASGHKPFYIRVCQVSGKEKSL